MDAHVRRIDASVGHAAVVAFAALATAWNSRENGFVWDDRAAIIGNSDVDASESQWWQVFQHDFWGYPINTKTSHKSYRPLTVLTFRWDRSLYGLDARGFHLTNVLIHTLCSVLVYYTARAVYKSEASKKMCGALLAGLLFAVHPIHCDSIASIVGRADLLCVVCSLAGFLAYAQAEKTGSWHFLAAAVMFGVCACLCKELGITVYGIYVAQELSNALASHPSLLRLPRVRTRRLLCVLVSAACLLLARLWVNGEQTKAIFNILANSINLQESRLVRVMSYAHVHAWYLWKLVWPSWLSYDYGFNTIPVITSVTDPRNLLTAFAYATVIAGVAKGFQDIHRSPLLMCIVFGVIPFVPASNIFFPVGTIVAERLLYFPSVGFCLIIGYVADQCVDSLNRIEQRTIHKNHKPLHYSASTFAAWSAAGRRLGVALVGMILVTAVYKSMARNAEWKSEGTLFRAAVDTVPENVKVLNNAAKVYLTLDPERALKLARIAIALLPQHVEGQSNLGLAFTYTPKILLAIRHMAKAVAFSSIEVSGAGYAGAHLYNYWKAQNNDSTTERAMQSPSVKLAQAFLDMAIKRGSRTPLHFYQRGIIAEHLHDLHESLRYLQLAKFVNDRAVRLGLDNEMVLNRGALHNHAAIVRRHLGDEDEALTEMLAGIDLYPSEASLYFNAASSLISRGELDTAAALLDRCLNECEGADTFLDGARMLERIDQLAAARAFRERAATIRAMGNDGKLGAQDSQ